MCEPRRVSGASAPGRPRLGDRRAGRRGRSARSPRRWQESPAGPLTRQALEGFRRAAAAVRRLQAATAPEPGDSVVGLGVDQVNPPVLRLPAPRPASRAGEHRMAAASDLPSSSPPAAPPPTPSSSLVAGKTPAWWSATPLRLPPATAPSADTCDERRRERSLQEPRRQARPRGGSDSGCLDVRGRLQCASMLSFAVGQQYSRKDVQNEAGCPDAKGGTWDTGVVTPAVATDFVIFATVVDEGRTDHDYPNRWEDSSCRRLRWYHKNRPRIHWPSVRGNARWERTSPRVLAFFEGRSAFTYAGLATAIEGRSFTRTGERF